MHDVTQVIQVPVVIAENTEQVLVVAEIPLCPPAFKLEDETREIVIDDCAISCGKAIINGRLKKNITYKTIKDKDCKPELRIVCGDIRHCTVEIPFHLFVDLPGASDCDMCEVIDAIAAGHLTKLIGPNPDGTYNCVLEKIVIKIRVKATQVRHIKVTGVDVTPPPLVCPPVDCPSHHCPPDFSDEC